MTPAPITGKITIASARKIFLKPCMAPDSGLHRLGTLSPPRLSFANPGVPNIHVLLVGAPARTGAEELGVVVKIEMMRLHEAYQIPAVPDP